MRFSIKEQVSKDEVIFWLLFFLINALLFLPWYLFSLGESDFIPYSGFFSELLFDKLKFIFIRYNFDIFRVSIELVLLFTAYYFVTNGSIKNAIKFFAIALFLFLLVFQIYSSFFQSIYQVPALFYNDFPMLENGFKILRTGFSFKIGLFIIISIVVLFGLGVLVKLTFHKLDFLVFGRVSKLIIAALFLFCLVNFVRFRLNQMPTIGAQLMTVNVVQNINKSIKLKKEIERIDFKRIPEVNESLNFRLRDKPNIYILFIESYGGINITEQELLTGYKALLDGHGDHLKTNGWVSASSLSTAPVTGGASWLSYTTFMLGYKVDNRSLYNTLLNNKAFTKYNHLFRSLRQVGYKNYRLNPIFEPKNFGVPWDLFTTFYAVDEWIKLNDMSYEGIMYGYGPSPPDHYSLNKAYQIITQKSDQPFVLFSLSKNSHTPFPAPYELKENWKDWNQEKGENMHARFFEIPSLAGYEKSIKYQLDNVFDFIDRNGADSDIFVIVGDHQPPAFNTKSFNTPIHIVSKDTSFINGFSSYGFSDDLWPGDAAYSINHEGFYSMFLREFIRNYGVDTTNLPIYFPNGINFE